MTMLEETAEQGVIYELSNCEIMRLDVDDEHYYYGGAKGEEKKYFMSLTKVLDIGSPFPEGLRQYLRMTSFEEQKDRLEYTGARGSKLHAALDMLMKGKELDLREYQSTYEKDAVVTFIRMMRFLTPGKFHTELIVADPQLRIAGTLDFEGYVDSWKLIALLDPVKYLDIDNDGDFQLKEAWYKIVDYTVRQHIIIDWKFTGRNAYSHKVQVTSYKTMFNKSQKGRVSRAFTWRYSPRHKMGFDFNESFLEYKSFKRVYQTTLEYLGEFPEPPIIRRYPEKVLLFEQTKQKGK